MSEGGPGTAAGGEDGPEDQAYFQALEQTFARLRGSAVLLSPADWHIAREWRRRGIPLELVERTLEETIARRRERGAKRKVNSLGYFRPAVEAAWEEVEALTAPGRRFPSEPPLRVEQRLDALAAALPVALPDAATWAARIRALAGTAESVEGALAGLDAELLASVEKNLAAGPRAELASQVEHTLAVVRTRLPEATVEEIRQRLLRQALRRRLDLPVLSLFSVAPTADAD